MASFNGFDDFDFNFAFDSGLDIFGEGSGEPTDLDEVGTDPGIFLPNTAGRTEFLPPDPDKVPVIPDIVDRNAPTYAQRPAEERTSELFSHMHPHRQVLLGVLTAAQQPCSTSNIDQIIDELRANKFSVYSPANICTMLEQAGALERTVEDGTPYAEFQPTPAIVVIDGEEYWEPVPAPEPYWTTTAAGLGALEANDPMDRLNRTFQREEQYLPIYKQVLAMASEETPRTMSDFSAAVDSNPIIAEPRVYFVQHFVEQLERCEAIVWNGSSWRVTEIGAHGLEALANIENDFTAAEDAQPSVLETQGVNW